jgi:hypothetical protein
MRPDTAGPFYVPRRLSHRDGSDVNPNGRKSPINGFP